VGSSEDSRKYGFRAFSSAAEAATVFAGAAAYYTPGQTFDHEEEVFRKPISYETDLSVNGGTETTKYFASVLAKRDAGIVKSTFYDKRSLRLNVDQTVGQRVNLQIG